MIPKLQFAIDSYDSAEKVSEAIRMDLFHDVDVIEIGGIYLFEHGNAAIRELRRDYPDKEIVVDMKMSVLGYAIDGGFLLDAGADQCIVMYEPGSEAFQMLNRVNEKHQTFVYFYLPGDWAERRSEAYFAPLLEQGERHVIIHTPKECWSDAERKGIDWMNKAGIHLTVTGKLKPEDCSGLREFRPYSIIVGKGISGSSVPGEAVRHYKSALQKAFEEELG